MKTWIPDSRNFAYLTGSRSTRCPARPRCSSCPPPPSNSTAITCRSPPTPSSTICSSATPCAKLPAEMPVYALPPVHYGKSNEHIGFPGTLSVSASTFMAVLRDLGASIASAGFKKLVLYNTHGGNTSLIDVMARDLRAEFGLRTFALHGSGGISFEGLSPAGARLWLPRGRSGNVFPAGVGAGTGGPLRLHRRITSRTLNKPELLRPENAPGRLRLAHARHRRKRRAGRSASGHGGEGRALDRRSRHANRRGPRSDVPPSGSGHSRKMNEANLGRLRQRRAPRTRRALPHVGRRRTGLRSLLSRLSRDRIPRS